VTKRGVANRKCGDRHVIGHGPHECSKDFLTQVSSHGCNMIADTEATRLIGTKKNNGYLVKMHGIVG
jgi:hypothetical protein